MEEREKKYQAAESETTEESSTKLQNVKKRDQLVIFLEDKGSSCLFMPSPSPLREVGKKESAAVVGEALCVRAAEANGS